MSRRICTIQSIDHIVLTVTDISATISFYETLGMIHQEFTAASGSGLDEKRHSLIFGHQKINLHVKGREFEPKAAQVQVGSGDLCFVVSEPVETVLRGLRERGIEVLEGGQVVKRTGARGALRSVYIRDPDGNLVELSNYE